MARIAIGKAIGDWGWLEDFYNVKSLKLVSKSASKAVYRDADGDQIVLTGSGFGYKGNFATKGTVTGVDFVSSKGAKFLGITKGSFEASEVFSKIKGKDFFDLLSVLTAGNDTIKGSNKADDILIGRNTGNDKIYGLGGDDFIKGSAGNNFMDGGKGGFDVLTYQESYWDKHHAKTGIVLDVAKGKVTNSWGGTDTIRNFEEFRGSYKGDTFKGGSGKDVFMGLGGKDTFIGGKGVDQLRYHKDYDFGGKKGIVVNLADNKIKDGFGYVDTVKQIENVFGTYFKDVFIGDKADNMFRGISGRDSFDGGRGSDTVSFDWWENLGQKGVVVDMRRTTGNILDDGFGNTETARSIENIEGSAFNDDITLGKADGWAWGGAGNDRIVAGRGENWLDGDRGADTFVFLSAADSVATRQDTIEDFSRKQGDRIDVSGVADFAFIGKAAFSGAGNELNYAVKGKDTIVSGDIDGDKKADFVFKLLGKHALIEGDFIL